MLLNLVSVLSGLSISGDIVDASLMAEMYVNCSQVLPGVTYTLDDLAQLRLPEMKFTYTTCKGVLMYQPLKAS